MVNTVLSRGFQVNQSCRLRQAKLSSWFLDARKKERGLVDKSSSRGFQVIIFFNELARVNQVQSRAGETSLEIYMPVKCSLRKGLVEEMGARH